MLELPPKLDYTHNLAIRQNLFKALYYAVSDEGRFLSSLFPRLTDSTLEELKDFAFPIATIIERKPFFEDKHKEHHTHARDRACSRHFKAHELVYRCHDCGFDDTCVICSYCFNKEAHIGHNVTVYNSSGDNGGICDCGDPEAFVRDIKCKAIIDSEMLTGVHEDFDEAIRETISFVLKYVLDVLNFSCHTLPFIHQNINGRGNLSFNSKVISELSSLDSVSYGAWDVNSSDLWYLILWNDENHDFEEAKAGIRAATGYDAIRADKMAQEINTHGRCILKEAKEFHELLAPQTRAEAGGLVASICTARDYMRDTIVHYMINWLYDICDFQGNNQFRERCKEILAEELLKENHVFTKYFPMDLFKHIYQDIEQKCFESGFLYYGRIPNLGSCSVNPNTEYSCMNEPTKKILTNKGFKSNFAHSKLQFLLTFEIRLTSLSRKKLSKLLLQCLIQDPSTKSEFARQFVDIYPNLLNILALSDREEDLNLLNDITTQLFTCPKTVLTILKENQVGNILAPAAKLIEEHSTSMNNESGYPNFIELVTDRRSRRAKSSIKKAVIRAIRDVYYLIDKTNLSVNKLEVFLSQDVLIMFILFLRNFQGYWAIERKYGEHVEIETPDYMIHSEYSSPILTLTKLITDCGSDNYKLMQNAAEMIIKFLKLRKFKRNGEIAEFKVSKSPVSFINPINALLSFLVQSHGFHHFQDVIFDASNNDFLEITDVSLRSIVLANQVKTGFWIRNGYSVSRQSSIYMGIFLRELSYFRDFHINQIGAIVQNPDTYFLNMLDRWELLNWFNNEITHENTVYGDRFSSIAENLIVFVYNLITNRDNFKELSSEERLKERAKAAILYYLCDEPKGYTDMKNAINTELTSVPNFDDLLNESADYVAPTGFFGTGLYRLKPEMFEKLDPLSLYLDPSQFQTVSESLIKNIAKNKKIREHQVMLYPELFLIENTIVNERLGRFTKSKHFAKFIYKLLQVAINKSDETYLSQLLHLIHAIILDDELLHGKMYLNENFVIIPISDLLLTIVESSMSDTVVRKADFLIDNLGGKDDRIFDALIDCFGEEHIETYKSRKADSSRVEKEEKKKQSDKRMAKIMKKFAKQREQFLEKNTDLNMESNTGTSPEREENIPLRTCVSCGETESVDKCFGLLASHVKSSVFWLLPSPDNGLSLIAFGELHSHSQAQLPLNYQTRFPYQEYNDQIEGYVMVLCGHGMHLECYDSFRTQKYNFCPLCHNFVQHIIPSFILNKAERDEENMNQLINKQPESFLPIKGSDISYSKYKKREISKSLIRRDYLNDPILAGFAVNKFTNSLHLGFNLAVFAHEDNSLKALKENLAIFLSNTIRAHEIASRYSSDNLGTFIDEIPSSIKALLISWIQNMALSFIKDDDATSDLNRPLTDVDLFTQVVVRFFKTDESFLTLAKDAVLKQIALASKLLSNDGRYSKKLSYFEKFDLEPEICQRLETALKLHSKPEDLKMIFFGIQRLLLPLLRRLWIFKCILTCIDNGENTFVAADGNKNFDMISYSDQESMDALLFGIGFKGIDGLFDIMAKDDSFDKLFRDSNDGDRKLTVMIPQPEYPGLVKLVDLPDDYNQCLMNNTTRDSDSLLCLHCGKSINSQISQISHLSRCCGTTAISYLPQKNIYYIVINTNETLFLETPGHYLTVHGEVKRQRSSEKATLNHSRFRELNKMWITLNIYTLINRSVSRYTPIGIPQELGLRTGDSLDEEELDMFSDDEEADFEEADEEMFVDLDGDHFVW